LAKRNLLLALLTLLAGLLPHPTSAFAQSASPEILARAKAVLEKNCFECHGSAQMSGLDLRQRATMLKGGTRGPAIVPGNPEGSLLYRAMTQTGDLKMPQARPRLPDADLIVIYDWIKNGSPWDEAVGRQPPPPTWWSFRKPVRPPMPAVKNTDWVRNPIDAFVRAKLEQKGFQPAPRADRRTIPSTTSHPTMTTAATAPAVILAFSFGV